MIRYKILIFTADTNSYFQIKLMSAQLAIIVPCYNEEAVFPESCKQLLTLLNRLIEQDKVKPESYLCFVNDGSQDRTWELIEQACEQEGTKVRGIKLATNFGHQNALMAGMLSLGEDADCFVTVDADLQDDIQVVEEMVQKYQEGFKIVYGVREGRKTDSFFKRFTAKSFYRLMEWMKVKTVYNHADFRLIDHLVLEKLALYGEVNLFLRGIFPTIGFASTEVFYERKARVAGESKYPLRKMMAFAWEGITSFSTYPLHLIFLTGIFIFILSIALTIWAIVPLFQGNTVHGWASTVIPIFVFAGVQMMSIGLIGEYVGKIYKEVKSRPRFIIESFKNMEKPEKSSK